MNTIDEKTFKQGVDEFIGCAPEGGWSDYWAMQQDWEFYKDSLCRDGVITQKQADSWSNPCTPETFARWQKRNGLVRRGYESKKSEGHDTIVDYFHSDPEVENSEALEDLTVTVSDNGCDTDSVMEDGESSVELCTWLPDGTSVAITVGICDDGNNDKATYAIDVGKTIGRSPITEWDKAYTADELSQMWVDFEDDLKKVIAEHPVGESKKEEPKGESHKKSEASGNIRYDVPVSSTTYASELESLVSKLKTLGISVKPKIYAEEDITNGYAEYKLFGANSRDDIVVIVDISENHYTRITAITNRGKLVMEGYGQTFDEALSALNIVEESKKSEALTKDTVVVGTLDNSSKAWIERTLKQIKKKFPNVESDAFGCTITIRGKLADVSAVCDAYPKGVSSLWTDKGGDFLPNAAGDNLDYEEVGKVLSESKKSEGIGDRIKMGIDYNMFMRMCGSAAYLDDNEDYWDALWEYYSEMGEIEDACEFFDNLFQYTAWCDADEVYEEYLDDKFKDESKSKEECIQAAIDDGDLDAYKHEKGNYLVIL